MPLPGGAPAQPKQGGGSTAAIMIIGAVLLVALFACAGVCVLLGSDTGKSTASQSRSATLRDASSIKLRDKLTSLGFSIIGETTSTQQGLALTSLTVTKTGKSGAVMLYRFDDATLAQRTESSLRNNPNAAVARDGSTLLMVVLSPTGSRELLDSIVR
jgi:hypothetical protein